MGTMDELEVAAARIDLAAAFRLAVRMDLHEGVCNHFSLMPPDKDGTRTERSKRFLLFLANHGVIVAGRPVAEAFDLLYYLERVCRLQVLARSTGGRLKPIRSEVVRETYRMMLADAPKYAAAHFAALKRVLDRVEPDYSH
jgi:ribulose-5-phosphate 4-epimerase/fuculose-1-phosphate aldolase